MRHSPLKVKLVRLYTVANLTVITHPLIAHKLTLIRDVHTSPKDFRQIVGEITQLMVFEITRDLTTHLVPVQTPMQTFDSPVLSDSLLIVPILRAGLGMEQSVQSLIPNARVAHVGMYRDPITHVPKVYYHKFPSDIEQYQAIIVDPLLATGGSVIETIRLLKTHGVHKIRVVSLIGVKEGVSAIHSNFDDVDIFLAALDPVLNENKYIEPGLGDAGDRLFGTR